MNSVRTIGSLVLGLWMSAGVIAPAQAQSPDIGSATDLVRLFFASHTQRFQAGSSPLLNDTDATRPFLVDCLAVDGLQGRLGFDPVYGAQDADVTELEVFPDPDAPILRGAAQIHVSFRNFGAPRLFIYTLIPVSDGAWQINDIYSDDDGWTLSGLMRDAGIASAACDPKSEITLFGMSNDQEQEAADAVTPGMEEGDLPGHMDGAEEAQEVAENDIGMEQGDLPGDGVVAGKRDLLFILDASGSMWGQIDGVAKISTAKQALRGLVGDLDDNTSVGLMAYGHRREGDCSDIEVLLSVADHAPGQVGPAIDSVTPRGKTPIAGALEAAAGSFGNPDRPADVLLISDGLETCGGDPCAAAEALAAQGIGTRVHVVGFDLKEEEKRALQCIADRGNGTYYTADNSEEFGDALKQIANTVNKEPAAPEPQPAPEKSAIFEETFDGPGIDPSWEIVNENTRLEALDGQGALFVAAAGKETFYEGETARNRFVLDSPLPEGDFDLVLKVRFPVQTGSEHAWLSVFESPTEQIGALAWATWKGCGPAINFSLVKVSGPAGEKPEKTAFEHNLFNKGNMLSNLCTDERGYGDAILQVLEEEGATIRLKRRGRALTAVFEMTLPAYEDKEARLYSFETEAITALRLSGRPSFFMGQWSGARNGESHFFVDHFAIESGDNE
ncbi:MAG: VWA domain-containing protein [Hoeflea sp.]|uniref:vWA domain-containing protein n=1 Tax=Hoeflea sp. TaxID=1940281 RepID=UPI0032EDACF2